LNLLLVASRQRTERALKVKSLALSLLLFGTASGAWLMTSPGYCLADSQPQPRTINVTEGDKSVKPAQLNLQQLPTLIDIPQTPESIEKVLKLEEEGEKFFGQRDLDKALAKWQEAYGLCLEMKYAEGEGRALTNMCRIFLERGQFVKAKYMGENAIEVLAAVSDQKALGRAHLFLAQAYFGLDNPVWAGQQLELAMKSFTAAGGNNAADTARAMLLASSVLVNMGKLKESIQFLEAAATYFTQAGDNGRAIASHLRVVDIFLGQGLCTAAEEEAEKAVSLARAAADAVDMVAALSSQANCCYSFGEYAQAKKLYEQVFQIADKLASTQLNSTGRAQLELGYGSTLSALGDYDQARVHLQRALPVFKSAGMSLSQSQTANVLGVLEETQGHHDKAVQLLSEALDLHNLISPKNDNFHIQVLSNLASIESRLGRNRDAKAHLETAASIAKKIKDDTALGRLYASGCEVALRLAEQPLAEQLVKAAIECSAKVNDDSALWQENTLLAKIQLSQGNPNGARESLTSALSFFRSPQAGKFSSCERIPYPISREDLAEELVAMLVGEKMTEQALLTAEQLKEECFIDQWLGRGGQVRPDDAELYNDLVTQRAHLHASEVASPPSRIVKEWQSWMARFRTLYSQNRVLARLIAPVPATIADVTKAVQASHATVLEYLIGGNSTVVFVVNGAGRISPFVLPVGRKRLETQVTSLLSAVPTSDANSANSALTEKRILQALYPELMPPSVEALLPDNADQIVAIIPDGILFNLPFAALVNPQGKYFIEKHTITLASSIGLFLDSPPRYADDLSVVVACSRPKNTGDSSDDEATTISGLFEPEYVTRLIGKDADMKSIQEQAKGKAVVHIADDLAFSGSNPFKSTLPLIFGKDESGHKVTADHLFGLSIPSDLLVWSGTSVNAKDLDGNTLNVFTRGLNYAGVRNVLMSLWVEPGPQRTSELVDFYKNKQAGLNQAESLRKAELLALEKDPSPWTWAAFQLVGPGY
jgi:CHAT domain-containing protein/tetratricopeptide (TPR) repeat protein